MLSTAKTKMYGYVSMLERILAYNLSVRFLPFLVVFERCTTLARFDLGISNSELGERHL